MGIFSILIAKKPLPDIVMEGAKERAEAGELVTVPEDVYARGCIKSMKDGLEAAIRIGFPVMIKASEGGGGKGIRKVKTKDDFELAYHQVQGEIPGSPIFVMQLAHKFVNMPLNIKLCINC